MDNKKTLQWTGSGVLSHPMGRNKPPIKYGDVLTKEVLKALGGNRVTQFIGKGKIGQVPMPIGPDASDKVVRLQGALSKLQNAHDDLLKVNNDLFTQGEDLKDQVVELSTANEAMTKDKADKKLTQENENLAARIQELEKQIEDLK